MQMYYQLLDRVLWGNGWIDQKEKSKLLNSTDNQQENPDFLWKALLRFT